MQLEALQYYMTSMFIEKAQQSDQLSSFSLIHGKHQTPNESSTGNTTANHNLNDSKTLKASRNYHT